MFIVIEIQKTGDTVSTLVNSYTDYKEAASKYHTILSYAAKSEQDIHSAVILDEYGNNITNESYSK